MTLECGAKETDAGVEKADWSWSLPLPAIDPAEAWNSLLRGEWVVSSHAIGVSERTIVASPTTPTSRAEALDAVELGVAMRRARGEAVKAIAVDLGRGVGTVHRHIASVMTKFKASHQAGLVALLKEHPPRGLAARRARSIAADFLVFTCPVAYSALPPCLTAAEQAIVLQLVAGSSQRAIARARGTSVRTVANQVASVFRKLRVCSRVELFAALAAR
jgi:DNA-binding NarL/FixJ family response regulator